MIKPKVAVMGSFVVDLMARTPHLPVVGETVKGSLFKMGPGGKGSNQGVSAQRSGSDVTMITKIGQDVFGDIACNNFLKEKMNLTYVFRDEEKETGTALIMVDENTSDNKILVTLGACGNLTKENIEKTKEVIESSDVFLTQLETNMDAVTQAIDIAYNKDIPVILNPAPIQEIPDGLLKKVYILTPNETEAAALTGIKVETLEDAKESAKILKRKGAHNVIITMGSKGALIATKDSEIWVESLKVNAIDTTGAGDAFNGALATALAEGKNIEQAAIFANAAAAISVTRMGTAVSMAYKDEIETLLNTK
ncbi:MAG: ribokinase [Vallitalea sp.]|jgi:ribokinase|nr:ribokinase [Vallitalea sp.]